MRRLGKGFPKLKIIPDPRKTDKKVELHTLLRLHSLILREAYIIINVGNKQHKLVGSRVLVILTYIVIHINKTSDKLVAEYECKHTYT